jgi:hypothetical protein
MRGFGFDVGVWLDSADIGKGLHRFLLKLHDRFGTAMDGILNYTGDMRKMMANVGHWFSMGTTVQVYTILNHMTDLLMTMKRRFTPGNLHLHGDYKETAHT